MRVDGLNGNNPTPIQSWGLTASNTVSSGSGGAGAGKASFTAVSVFKMLDGLSIPLQRAASLGTHFDNVVIDVFEAGSAVPFATYTFGNVFVTTDAFGASPNSVTEQVLFEFERISADITLNGVTSHSCFDVGANAGC